jgi:hypothetical protein
MWEMPTMRDATTYRRYAQECRRLANMMPAEHRHVLLEIAETWSDLAQGQDDPRPTGHELTEGRAN